MTSGCERLHAPEACTEDFGRLEKSQWAEIETWARPDEFVHYGRRACWGAHGNVIIERFSLSLPYVEKSFNSKVIKSFVPELRSHKCFLCFGIPMYMCVMDIMNILCTSMNMSISRIHISGCIFGPGNVTNRHGNSGSNPGYSSFKIWFSVKWHKKGWYAVKQNNHYFSHYTMMTAWWGWVNKHLDYLEFWLDEVLSAIFDFFTSI